MEQRKTNALGIVFFVGMFIWGAVLFYHYIGALDWWLDFRSATTRFLGTTAIVALTLFIGRGINLCLWLLLHLSLLFHGM